MTPSRRFNENWLPTFFDDFFDNEWMVRSKAAAPAMNVMENENDYKVEIAAPGMKKEDVNIHLDQDHNLVVSMEKKTENKEDDKKHSRYLRCEFSYSKFQQTLVLPDNVDKEKIHAAVNDGVLTIELPKLKPEDKIKTVKVIEVK
ncbi:Hsp20/alpha crystallin family protein [Phocaeicola abscessus]|uniref:Hsp20/alpha crystallin family protein n=1 Tax=Phocaeicola abscessus TaxID=555313 RepID=UPI00054F2600|nr:Hsp20/alpha crystallin family protein [Phocaeicola abscessus]